MAHKKKREERRLDGVWIRTERGANAGGQMGEQDGMWRYCFYASKRWKCTVWQTVKNKPPQYRITHNGHWYMYARSAFTLTTKWTKKKKTRNVFAFLAFWFVLLRCFLSSSVRFTCEITLFNFGTNLCLCWSFLLWRFSGFLFRLFCPCKNGTQRFSVSLCWLQLHYFANDHTYTHFFRHAVTDFFGRLIVEHIHICAELSRKCNSIHSKRSIDFFLNGFPKSDWQRQPNKNWMVTPIAAHFNIDNRWF